MKLMDLIKGLPLEDKFYLFIGTYISACGVIGIAIAVYLKMS